MKILIVTGIFPPDHGGPASYVPRIAEALAKRHDILAVVTLSDSLSRDDSDYPFPVVRIPRRQNRLVRRLRTIAAIRALMPAADVVFLNGLVFEGMVACKLLGRKPAVVKIVGDLVWERARNSGATVDSIEDFQNGRHGFKWDLLKDLQRRYVGMADAVITPSRYLARIVEHWGVPREKVAVVYNSVHAAPFRDAAAERSPSVDCVTVARLVPWKGIAELIDVVARAGWSLTIVGDGPMREALERRARESGNASRIRFRGQVPQEEVVAEIADGRVFVLNSSYEGLPHIVLEAKAAGVPVVAASAGGTPETITHLVDGILVSPGDCAALEESIRMLLDRPEERRRIGEAGRSQVLERFSFETMVRETERLLEAAAGPRGYVARDPS